MDLGINGIKWRDQSCSLGPRLFLKEVNSLRIDKFLKNSRLIKRRTLAKDACEQERVFINDKPAKPGSEVKPGDVILIRFGNGEVKARVLQLLEHVTKETSPTMYEIIE